MSHPWSQSLNKYWIPNKDIHKKVITAQLHSYLGPESTVRPYTKDGEDGFLITTAGSCLNDDQIDEICNKSSEKWDQMTLERCLDRPDFRDLKRPLHVPVLISKAVGKPYSPNDYSLYGKQHENSQQNVYQGNWDHGSYSYNGDRHQR